MVVTVVGCQYKEGISKKTNKSYAAFFTSVTYPVNGYAGVKAEEMYIPKEITEGIVPQPGESYNVEFNRGGFVSVFKPIVNGK